MTSPSGSVITESEDVAVHIIEAVSVKAMAVSESTRLPVKVVDAEVALASVMSEVSVVGQVRRVMTSSSGSVAYRLTSEPSWTVNAGPASMADC